MANFTSAASFAVLALFVVAQVLAWIYSQTTIMVVFFIFISPLLMCMIWEASTRRMRYIQENCRNRFKFMNNIYERELPIRFLIQELVDLKANGKEDLAEEVKLQIKMLFKELRKKFYTCKLVSVLEFIYFYSVIEDENLAGLKLSFAIEGKFDVEYSFSEYRCRRMLTDSFKVYSEEHDYMKFRKMYDNVKRIDEKACLLQLEFWNELSTDLINIKKIESLSYALHKVIEDTYKTGRELYETYPNKASVLRLYGSFLMDIYNDTEKGNELLSKSENIRANDKLRLRYDSKFSYFDENAGVIVISGTPESVGMVDYVSPEAYSILGLNNTLRLNLHISNFSPHPLNNAKFHNKVLVNILKSRDDYDLKVPTNNFIVASDGFLVEVMMHMKCLAWDSYPFFIMSLKRKKVKRECLLFDADYSILAHTRNFGTLFRYMESYYIVGMNINHFIPELVEHIERVGNGLVFEYDTPSDRLFIKIQEQYHCGILHRVLYITNNITEAKVWSSKILDTHRLYSLKSYTLVRTLSENLIAAGMNHYYKRKGILKNPKLNYPKKELNVIIDDRCVIHELPWTDFKPGKSKIAKDAKVIFKPVLDVELNMKPIERGDISLVSNLSEILDLKDAKADDILHSYDAKAQRGKKSPSASSSVVSKNASATRSVAVQKLIESVNSSIKRFKCAFFSTNIVVILAIAAIMIYLILNARFYKYDMLMPHICTIRYNSVTLAEYVRFLNIHHQLSNSTELEQSLRTRLAGTMEEFNYYINSLEDKIKKRPGKESDSIYKEVISTFVKHNNTYVVKKETLIDALRNLYAESQYILASPIEEITTTNPHFYYVIRNGVEETSKTVNNTVYEFLDIEKQNLEDLTQIVNLLGAGAAFLIVICFFAIILPTLIQIEKANQNVWRFFYSLQFTVVQEMRFRCEERLESMHGTEVLKKPHKAYRFKENESRKKIRNSSKWKSIMLKLSIYYICSIVLFIYIYCVLMVNFTEVVGQKPEIINWASMIISAIEEGLFWRLEISYLKTPFGYFSIIPEYQVNEPYERMREMIDLWDYSEKVLLTEVNLHIDSSSEQEKALFVDGCIYEPCSVYLKKGIHPALMKLRGEVNDALNIFLPYQYANVYLAYKEEITRVLKHLLELYENILNKMIEDSVEMMQGIAFSYCILVLILYLFIYIPTINKVREEVTNVWDNTRLIPISLIQRSLRDKSLTI